MAKNADSNNLEKTLLFVLSLISVGLLVAIVYVWYTALGTGGGGTKPGDFLKPDSTTQTANVSGTPEATSSGATQTGGALTLSITSPAAQEVVSAKSVVVTGITLPSATLTITGGKDDVISSADADGAFTESVNLDEGQNNLVVSAFDGNGNQVNQTVSVVYVP